MFAEAFAATREARALAGLVWGNLTLLARVRMTGADGRLRVSWSVGTETALATHTLVPRLSGGRVVALEALGAHPVWLGRPLVVDDRGPAVLLATDAAEPATRTRWADAAAGAVALVAAAGLGPAASGWDGTLVVELPADVPGFARVAGVRDGLESTGAVTRVDAPDAAPRVVVNPGPTRGLPAGDALVLLTHEGVHVATRSPWSAAPLWVVEGVAEQVAATASETHAQRNLTLVRAYVARHGLPHAPPSDSDLGGAGPGGAAADGETAYALAAVAVEALAGRYGRERAMAWVADWSAADRPAGDAVARAYAEALAALG